MHAISDLNFTLPSRELRLLWRFTILAHRHHACFIGGNCAPFDSQPQSIYLLPQRGMMECGQTPLPYLDRSELVSFQDASLVIIEKELAYSPASASLMLTGLLPL